MRNKIFDSIPVRKPKRNAFNLSHEKKLTMNFGELIPFYCQSVLPGDLFKCSNELLLRFAPMVAPIMHRVNVFTHYFFVPNRLVWENWKTFITGGPDGKQAPSHPYLYVDEQNKAITAPGSLLDYFGIPDVSTKTLTDTMRVNSIPFRAYQLIYNEYYRDQNLIPDVGVPVTDGIETDLNTVLTVRKRAWNRDYFDTALPWTQRGDDVLLPYNITYKNPSLVLNSAGAMQADGPLASIAGSLTGGAGSVTPSQLDNIESMEITVNDLRTTARLQEYLEKMARSGSRYVEQILALWGVISDDLQQSRPLYLGGNTQPVQISEVLATFQNETVAQGTMAGHGLSVGAGGAWKKYFKEHGYIIGLLSVMPRSSYMQGIPKDLINKSSKFQYFTPDFANLGEQPVENQEIYWEPSPSGSPNLENNAVWGYQSRYAEYRFNNDTVHGEFKTSLNYWTMVRKFNALPSLNKEFIECTPTTDIWADTTGSHKLYVQLYNHVKAIRPIPLYAVPKL